MPDRTSSEFSLDAVLVRAVETARDALRLVADDSDVGDPLDVVAEAERVVTHRFACTRPGYRGWYWSVTVARAPRQRLVTVDEVVLLPGDEAVMSPAWVPWADRVLPGDVGPGDMVPVDDDDPRLVAGWLTGDPATEPLDDEGVRAVAREVGLGRERVLSLLGRDDAAERWYDGERGPSSTLAKAAPARCVSCGFLVRLGGPLGTLFGVCANGNVRDDGQVVAFDHGCGGHSDVREPAPASEPMAPVPAFDTLADAPLVFD